MSETERKLSDEAPGRRQLRPLIALWPYIWRHPGMVLAALVALVASAAAMLTVPVAVRGMVDFGFADIGGGAIDGYFLTLIAVGFVLAVASAARMYAVNWLGERVVADLRSDAFGHLAGLGPAFYETTHSGEVMSRLTADTTQIKAAAGSALSQALRNLIMLTGALIMMFVTSPTLSVLALAAIPAIVFPLLAYGRAVQRLSRTAQDRLADASAYAADNLGAVRAMVAFGQEAAVSRRFAAAVERAFGAARARLLARGGLTAIAIFLVVTGIVGVLWFGARMVVAGEMSGGRLGQFILYAVFAAGALAELAEVWGELAQAAGAAERLTELMAVRPQIAAPAHPKSLPVPPLGTVEFRDVRFVYPTRPGVSALNGVSFRVAPGETVALVGPSGAGKSTIFNLILRFYDPQEGEVMVDGRSVDEVDPAELRARLALVPQEVALFDDTLAENIRYGAPEASSPKWKPPPQRPRPTASSPRCPKAMQRAWASAGSSCPAASASASPLRGPCCAMRRSCCSTKPPARWTLRARPPCSGRWRASWRAAPPSSSRTGWPPCSAPAASWSSTRAKSSRRAATPTCCARAASMPASPSCSSLWTPHNRCTPF